MRLGELRRIVILRDGQCMAVALGDLRHQCRDAYGNPHSPTDLDKLTLEHVKDRGVRRDEEGWCIALCSEANVVEHWTSPPDNNRVARAYLAGVKAGER